MAKISLRSYNREIEGLIDKGQVDEAVAHCRHVLKSFPKHLATYRLLGKAFLETQRYGEAADIFLRVLSSIPDDFVSHVGVSIIREDESNLDAAIWHMERAFEVQPYNSAIQDELRRLYGRRDGLEPPRVRLTRGALARMYAKGDLYQQSIAELRAALAEDSHRPDLQVLLARVYFLADQRVEAVETCSALINKMPYCLEANRILSAILPDTERKDDTKIYHQRVISLDPYIVQASPRAASGDEVPENSVMLEKLEYQPGGQGESEPSQPSWAASLGVAFDQFAPKEENMPDWLAPASDEQANPPGEDTSDQSPTAQEFSWDAQAGEAPEKPEIPDWLSEDKQEAGGEAEPADKIPDWMKGAGWGTSSGTVEEGEALSDLPDETPGDENEIAPAEIPDWLRSMAPTDIGASPIANEKAEDELLPWLQETAPGSSDTVVSWLGENKGGQPAAVAPNAAETPSEPAVPDWLKDLSKDTPGGTGALEEAPSDILRGVIDDAMSSGDIPDWLKEMETESSAKEETPEAALSPGEIPDWLKGLGSDAPQTEVETQPEPEAVAPGEPEDVLEQAELPDWLQEAKPVMAESEAAASETAETVIMGEVALPDWMQDTEKSLPEDTVAEIAQVEIPAQTEPGLPDWLAGAEQEIPEEKAEVPQETGLPDWLAGIEEAPAEVKPEILEEMQAEPAAAETLASETPTVEAAPMPDLDDTDAALAWLESLAAKQGAAEEELITKPEERLEAPPAWV
ncbi:MAG: hypothetical protein EHM70_08570, partial [Chloroflexota bacterium]